MILRLFTRDIIFKLKNKTISDLENYKGKINKNIGNQSLYLFYNSLTSHDPYIPLQRFMKKFGIFYGDFLNIKETIVSILGYRRKVNINSGHMSKKQVKSLKLLYDAGVASADVVLRKLFCIFKELELLDNSYIIITSDHGEHLGDKEDHYLWEHSTYLSLYEGVIRVPLFILNKNFPSQKVKEQVQLKDIFHTILHLAGSNILDNQYLDLNQSILYQIENNLTPRYIFGEFLKNRDHLIKLAKNHSKYMKKDIAQKLFSYIYFLRSDGFKYILYNRHNIPGIL